MSANVTVVPVPLTPAELGIHLDNSLGAAFIGLVVAAVYVVDCYAESNLQLIFIVSACMVSRMCRH